MSRSPARTALLLLCIALPFPLAAQEQPVVDPLAKLDPTSRFQIELILDSARNLGIPDRSLRSKAMEGLSKRANARTIVAVVRQTFNNMRVAKVSLGPAISEDEIAAAASLLNAGVSSATLTQFRREKAGKPIAGALIVLGDLITRGIPRDEASSTILRMWQDGASDADFYGLWTGVDRDILSGTNPGTALQQRAGEFRGRAPDKISQPASARPPEQPETKSS